MLSSKNRVGKRTSRYRHGYAPWLLLTPWLIGLFAITLCPMLASLYLSFTNCTAFSPTDTMPLKPSMKLLMLSQGLTALVTIGVVVARAISLLG